MIVAQISDTHVVVDAPDSKRRIRDFARTVADINALDPPPDAIVHTGDIAHNGRRDEYVLARAILAAARAPAYVLAGNKDDRENLRAVFSDDAYFPPDRGFVQYAIGSHPVRLVALDTMSLDSNKGDFCRQRLAHLLGMLDADTTRPVAVFTHHPPFEVMAGPDRLHFKSPEAMAGLCAALQRSKRVAAVFSGHIHRAAEGRVGNIPAAVVPCTATDKRYGAYPAHMRAHPVYYVHRFDPVWGFSTETRIVDAALPAV